MLATRPSRRRELLDRQAFSRRKVQYWIYAIVWIGLVAGVSLSPTVPWIWKGVTLFLLTLATPALSDLFESFEAHVARRQATERPAPE